MPPKKPVKSTDRRRGPKTPPEIKQQKRTTLEEANQIYEDAATQPWTPLFNDRRGAR